MAKISVKGLDTFTTQLTKLANEADKINRGALGEGAGLVADKVKEALESLPVRDDSTHPHRLYGATASEKSQIVSNFGITRFKNSGGKTETNVGFTGYVNTPSKRFGDQVPTGMLMQCIEYGTAFRTGTHTVNKAIKAVKGEVSAKMQEYIEDKVNKIMK